MSEITKDFIEKAQEDALIKRTGVSRTTPNGFCAQNPQEKNGPVTVWPSIDRIRDRIKWLRKKEGMTQTELAERLGVSKACVGFWESGKNALSERRAEDVSRVYGCPIEWLMRPDKISPKAGQKEETPKQEEPAKETQKPEEPAKETPKPDKPKASLRMEFDGEFSGREVCKIFIGLDDATRYKVRAVIERM